MKLSLISAVAYAVVGSVAELQSIPAVLERKGLISEMPL
jgi:hypothetical protein